jgi:hypothetical protein
MHRARLDLVAAGQVIALEDASWLPLLRTQRSRRNHRRLAALMEARWTGADAPGDQDLPSP